VPKNDTAQVAPALGAMLITQALVVAASLTPPVLGPAITADLAVPTAWSGYYASLVFASALVSAQFVPRLIAWQGPLRTSQWTLVLAAAGLVCAASATMAGVVLSALLIGCAYAPGNPASSSLLARVVPPARRAFIFSLKQTSIPIGGMIAGLGAPALIWLTAGALASASGPVGSTDPQTAAASWTPALLALAAMCLVAGIAVQPWRRAFDQPVKTSTSAGKQRTPLRLVAADPSLRTLAVVSFSMSCLQLAYGPIIVAFLADDAGTDLATAGGIVTVAMAASVALRIGLGAVADQLGGTRVLAAIALVMVLAATASAVIAATGAEAAPLALVAAIGAILGASSYSWNGVYLAEVAKAAPPDAVAAATAGTMTMVFLGGFVGPAVTTAAIALTGTYAMGFVVMAVFAAVAGIAIITAPLAR